ENISRAAVKLHVSQPALSKQVRGHRSTHVSDADYADLHVLAACSNGQAEEATLEEDHIARRRTCRQLRELGQRPLALLRRLRSIGLAQGAPNAVRVQIGAN